MKGLDPETGQPITSIKCYVRCSDSQTEPLNETALEPINSESVPDFDIIKIMKEGTKHE